MSFSIAPKIYVIFCLIVSASTDGQWMTGPQALDRKTHRSLKMLTTMLDQGQTPGEQQEEQNQIFTESQASRISKYTIAGGCIAGSALLVCLGFLVWWILRIRKPIERRTCVMPEETYGVPRQFQINGIGNLKVFDVCIGKGSFGKIWKGILLDPEGFRVNVAVKEINHATAAAAPSTQTIGNKWEVLISKRCKNKNIVRCFGSVYNRRQGVNTTMIILEWLPFTLNQLIHDDDAFATSCTYKDLLEIFSGIARGLRYLHRKKRVIHFDLNPRNVMMETNTWPKISDFGVSKIQRDGSVEVSGVRGTRPYIAPEVLHLAHSSDGLHKVNEFVDVYSFGILMWECVMRQKLNHLSISRIEDDDGVTLYTETGSKKYRCDCPRPLKELIFRCLQFDFTRLRFSIVSDRYSAANYKRPSADSIVSDLENMFEEPWAEEAPSAWRPS